MAQTISTPAIPFATRVTNALGGALTFLARNNPRYQQLRAFQMMSDAQLAARGTTRAGVVRRAFSHRFYL